MAKENEVEEKEVEVEAPFELKGNLRKQKEDFSLVKDSTYVVTLKKFMGKDIPEKAFSTLENFCTGIALMWGNMNSVNNSQKTHEKLMSEYEYQFFTKEFLVGDCDISYTKGTSDPMTWHNDAKIMLDTIVGMTYGEQVSAEVEPEIIY